MTTIKEIRRANQDAGHHFFDPATMKHWHSRVLPTVYEGKGGVFFVTSERDEGALSRRFTVRQFHPETGQVTTPANRLNEYRHHPSKESAQVVASMLAKSPEHLKEAPPAPGEEEKADE